LALAEKELQQARKDNQVLTRYIHARRKEEAKKNGGGCPKEGEGGPKEGGGGPKEGDHGGGLMV
jgi:hypothetical protein